LIAARQRDSQCKLELLKLMVASGVAPLNHRGDSTLRRASLTLNATLNTAV